MQIQYTFNKNDEYYTPDYAVKPIIQFLKEGSKIWCPFDKDDSQVDNTNPTDSANIKKVRGDYYEPY